MMGRKDPAEQILPHFRFGPYFSNSDSKTATKALNALILALSSPWLDSKASSKILNASILVFSPSLKISFDQSLN
jgi:hypothetical protein